MRHTDYDPLYSVYFAPRGYARMVQLGRSIAHRHLTALDNLIGVIGDAGSGKSLLIRGMFPGMELTNDDNGVNIRPLPILDIDEGGFYQAHSYHLDVRFESAFTQMPQLAEAVLEALEKGKRVVIEHFELIYPLLQINASVLIGVGDEVIVCRPTVFGPEPEDIARTVFSSIKYRRMAHTAEDLTEHVLQHRMVGKYTHGDVKGFLLRFDRAHHPGHSCHHPGGCRTRLTRTATHCLQGQPASTSAASCTLYWPPDARVLHRQGGKLPLPADLQYDAPG